MVKINGFNLGIAFICSQGFILYADFTTAPIMSLFLLAASLANWVYAFENKPTQKRDKK